MTSDTSHGRSVVVEAVIGYLLLVPLLPVYVPQTRLMESGTERTLSNVFQLNRNIGD